MRIRKFVASILLIAMIFNTTIVLAKDRTFAEEQGYKDGRAYVLDEYRKETENAVIPLVPILPREREIEILYKNELDGETQSGRIRFFEEYWLGYEDGYKETREYLFGSAGDETAPEVELNYAESLGRGLGEIAGYDDYHRGVKSNWSKAIPNNSKITSMFDLNRQTSLYRSAFLSEFRTSFEEAYEEAFEYALLNTKDLIISSAVNNGKDVGLVLGKIYGAKDYAENKSYNVDRDLPTNRTIISDYLLNRTLDEYETGFLNGFKLGYEEGYTDAFYNSFKEAIEAGKEAGQRKGELMATQDYIENETMNWSRHKSLESAISAEYRLIYLANVYKDSFLNSFWAGFAEKYEETYKALINEQVNEKIAFGIIAISGGELSGVDNSIALEIQSGTFYNNTTLSIEKVFNDKYRVDESRYISASDIYNIELSNPSKNLDNSKAITIAMEYYGRDDGGIYKWVNNRWTYISSVVEDGMIYIKVNPNTLRQGDNLYRVLVDKKYDLLTDIRSHWAKDEINTLVRRNIINGYSDHTFRPDRNISRAEFLALLSRVYDWDLPKNTENIKTFIDFESFGTMSQLISYGIDAGYIQGYDDNTFRPNDTISYKEIEIIMGRVHNDPNFRWYNTSANMLYNKLIKSKSYNNMNNKITRAEVAYMLYIINEWRY